MNRTLLSLVFFAITPSVLGQAPAATHAPRGVMITFAGVYRVDGPITRRVRVVPRIGEHVVLGSDAFVVTDVVHDYSDEKKPSITVYLSTGLVRGE